MIKIYLLISHLNKKSLKSPPKLVLFNFGWDFDITYLPLRTHKRHVFIALRKHYGLNKYRTYYLIITTHDNNTIFSKNYFKNCL